jgi:nitroreductase
MVLMDLLKKRYSVRNYLPQPVEREKIERCLEAARLAPSACNSQPWRFIVVDRKDLKDTIAADTHTSFMPINQFTQQAPVIIVVIVEKSNISAQVGSILKGKAFNFIDAGIAVEHFCLQAVEEGLGTCIIGWFDEKAVKARLKIPSSKRVGLLITVGYSGDMETKQRPRLDLDAIRSYNKYQE